MFTESKTQKICTLSSSAGLREEDDGLEGWGGCKMDFNSIFFLFFFPFKSHDLFFIKPNYDVYSNI